MNTIWSTIVSSDTRFPFFLLYFDWIGSDGMRGVGSVGVSGNIGVWDGKGRAKLDRMRCFDG